MTVINKFVLMEQAKKVLKNAYCPYSKFPVGAAILFKDGKVITGANIENVSFGVTNCAERSAIFMGLLKDIEKEIFLRLLLQVKLKTTYHHATFVVKLW
ncbi:cytidine deaminase [Streptococcus pneumoniae]|nr:cytidine deaminase [Streptococcus pneumoniae]